MRSGSVLELDLPAGGGASQNMNRALRATPFVTGQAPKKPIRDPRPSGEHRSKSAGRKSQAQKKRGQARREFFDNGGKSMGGFSCARRLRNNRFIDSGAGHLGAFQPKYALEAASTYHMMAVHQHQIFQYIQHHAFMQQMAMAHHVAAYQAAFEQVGMGDAYHVGSGGDVDGGFCEYVTEDYEYDYSIAELDASSHCIPSDADAFSYGSVGGDAVVFSGTLKSLDKKRTFGFISCDDTRALYGRDVYVSGQVLSRGMVVGDATQFTYELDLEGRPTATWMAAL